jgi:hypothetical protein
VSEPVFPKIRERIKEAREKVKLPALRGEKAAPLGGGIRAQIGKGKLIERMRERATRVTERIEEVKPGIVPRIGEILSEWYPGKRIVTVVTPKTEIVRAGEYVQKEAEKVKPPEREGSHY